MQSRAKTVAAYLRSLSPQRRADIEALRKVILQKLPKGFEETIQFGMISYVIPLAKYPNTYSGQALGIFALASQKNYMALYLMSVYADKKTNDWFVREYEASRKKLDMGKSCVRFRRASDLPLELIGKAIARVPVEAYIRRYEQLKPRTRGGAARATRHA